MKTSKVFSSKVLTLLCLGWSLLYVLACENQDYEELASMEPISNQGQDDWVTLLDELVFDSNIIVSKESSIQQAVDASQPGDAIYIEPGTYVETVTINKANLKIIGLNGNYGENVSIINAAGNPGSISVTDNIHGVEIINVHHQNSSTLSENNPLQRSKQFKKRERFLKMKRTELTRGIAHYQFEVRVGKGEFDLIRIHRVVREHRPYRPVNTDGATFMIHGSSQNFDDIFLRPGITNANEQNSSPVYLAANYIDVWGIDLAWTLVPVETSDFSFMQNWGIERDVDHTLIAMSLARIIRGLTGQGFDRLNLLGFSYGVGVAYAAAGRETQQHPILRDVKGLVAAEGALKYADEDEESRIATCNRADVTKAQINSGIFQNSNGLIFSVFGDQAINVPNEPSSVVPGLNNFQAALFVGTSTFVQGNALAPFWHFVGGEFNQSGIPTGLLYSDPSRWVGLLSGLAPYQPQLGGFELSACLCNEEEVSIDDHLGEIKIPILYLGVAGGFGPQGVYTSSLTLSKDITHHIVSLQPEGLRAIDYGHADLFMGKEAAQLAWEVLRQWIVDHSQRIAA